jgi:hypothetical protein
MKAYFILVVSIIFSCFELIGQSVSSSTSVSNGFSMNVTAQIATANVGYTFNRSKTNTQSSSIARIFDKDIQVGGEFYLHYCADDVSFPAPLGGGHTWYGDIANYDEQYPPNATIMPIFSLFRQNIIN